VCITISAVPLPVPAPVAVKYVPIAELLAPIEIKFVVPENLTLYLTPVTKLPAFTVAPIAAPLAKTCSQLVVSAVGLVAIPVIPAIVFIAYILLS
jgi:hypothetical protein